jgi:undecaprenyl-diphosphatase
VLSRVPAGRWDGRQPISHLTYAEAVVFGLLTSVRDRQVHTPDQRLAWMLILATIPVGISWLALEHVFRTVLGKPIPAAIFLTLNGVILYGGERLRRRAPASPGLPGAAGSAGTAIPVSHAGRTRTAARQAARTDLASDRRLSALRFAEATLIGSVHVLALLPGISRSGVTMVAGLTRACPTKTQPGFRSCLPPR